MVQLNRHDCVYPAVPRKAQWAQRRTWGKYSGIKGRAKSAGRSVRNLGSNTLVLFGPGPLLMSLAVTLLICKMVELIMPASVVSPGDQLRRFASA